MIKEAPAPCLAAKALAKADFFESKNEILGISGHHWDNRGFVVSTSKHFCSCCFKPFKASMPQSPGFVHRVLHCCWLCQLAHTPVFSYLHVCVMRNHPRWDCLLISASLGIFTTIRPCNVVEKRSPAVPRGGSGKGLCPKSRLSRGMIFLYIFYFPVN